MVEVRRFERTRMTDDRIAKVMDRRSGIRIPRRPLGTRGAAEVIRNAFCSSVTQEKVDDRARWLDGQVRGWTAGRAL